LLTLVKRLINAGPCPIFIKLGEGQEQFN